MRKDFLALIFDVMLIFKYKAGRTDRRSDTGIFCEE